MNMSTSTVTSKGQTTIPKDIRERLHVQAGDRIEFVVQDGSIVVRAANRKISDLRGFLPKPKKAVTLEQMDAAIRKRAGRG
ncbi:MAG TPA: AbrB/MazE/SpoVT family DNA-binding domain-containing protein [Rudaea sp.]|jgi:AbrB family looped-hinge helix DNA binding protein|nr:AbrB/MazE/SpoVT family DNA-binding domain-containing protein [Rudaea sp.]